MIWLPVFDSWKVCCLASTSDSLFTESLGEGRSHTPGSDDLALCVIRYAMHVCAKIRHWRSEKMLYLLLRVLADAYIGVRGELHRRLCLCSPLPSACFFVYRNKLDDMSPVDSEQFAVEHGGDRTSRSLSPTKWTSRWVQLARVELNLYKRS